MARAQKKAAPLSSGVVDRALLLGRGVAEIISRDELVAALESGRVLSLKEGFDPSSPDIHLGHAVGLRKLRQFQRLGHQVVLIVGDWTAQIGDPSGRSSTRPVLTREQVMANAQTYLEQFFRVVDPERTEVAWQSKWFGKFKLGDVLDLTGRFTLAQMLQREDFAKRHARHRPIALTEFLYPLLQAYDSVAVRSDVEFGGTDQKFNILVGRELQAMLGFRPQQVFLTPLLVGLDGQQKMSKSLGNAVGITEPPEAMYGKVMRLSDQAILPYLEALTDVPTSELERLAQRLEHGEVNPMEPKMLLASEIVAQFHSREAARRAEEVFEREHRRREQPLEAPRHYLPRLGPWLVVDLLVESGLAPSKAEARRLIAQGGVRLDGRTITDARETIHVQEGMLLRRGPTAKVQLFPKPAGHD